MRNRSSGASENDRWKELAQDLGQDVPAERRLEAQRVVFRAALPHLVRGLARRFWTLEPEDIEEIASDALLELFSNPERFDPVRSGLLAYLEMIARGDALNLLARRRRRPVSVSLSAARPEPYETFDMDQVGLRRMVLHRSRMVDAIDRLPARTRETMRLAAAGWTANEIAQELDCAPGTVRTRISRGIRMIRRDVEIRTAPQKFTTLAQMRAPDPVR